MENVKCPYCGIEIESDSFYCDQCGEELKVCPSGHGIKKGKVCSDCGTKLVEAKNAAGSPPLQTAPISPAPAPTQGQTVPVTAPGPQSTNAGQQPPAAAQPSPVAQADAAEKTVRPVAAPVEPKYLVSNALNARLELKNGAVIGRRAGDYVHVFGTQGYISGTHARVQKNGAGCWEIVDLDSSNGTFLNGQRLAAHQPAVFKIGDTIAFYDLKFTVSE